LTICVASFSTNVSSGLGLSVKKYHQHIKNIIKQFTTINICAVVSCGTLTVNCVLENMSIQSRDLLPPSCSLLHGTHFDPDDGFDKFLQKVI
jgi:hypothetical protein